MLGGELDKRRFKSVSLKCPLRAMTLANPACYAVMNLIWMARISTTLFSLPTWNRLLFHRKPLIKIAVYFWNSPKTSLVAKSNDMRWKNETGAQVLKMKRKNIGAALRGPENWKRITDSRKLWTFCLAVTIKPETYTHTVIISAEQISTAFGITVFWRRNSVI